MNREVIVDNLHFDFSFDEELNMWRHFGNKSLYENYSIDLEFEVKYFRDEVVDWNEVGNFLKYIATHDEHNRQGITSCQNLLNAFIREIWKRGFNEEDFRNIIFYPSGISYRGKAGAVYSRSDFMGFCYDVYLDPVDIRNRNRDLGCFPWHVSFTDNQINSVHKE